MINKKNIAIIVQIVIVILIFFSFKLIIDIFSDTSKVISGSENSISSIKKAYTTSNVIDSALSEKVVPEPFVFSTDISSPFSQLNAAPIRKKGGKMPSKPIMPRKKVFLKGILDKKNALALLEDEAGKTFICKIGDQVYNWTVTEIRDQHVVIKDGSYEEVLKVKGR